MPIWWAAASARERAAGAGLLQRGAVDELHGQEGAALVLAVLVERADVGMVERADGPRLVEEPQRRGAVGVIVQHLERHAAAEPGVLGEVHGPHRAAAERPEDPVVGDLGRIGTHDGGVGVREIRTLQGDRDAGEPGSAERGGVWRPARGPMGRGIAGRTRYPLIRALFESMRPVRLP